MNPSNKKIRLGLFLYTPMIGGAESYLKDLIWNLDRDIFDITLFYEPWEEFVDFLQMAECPATTFLPVRVIEQGGHFGAAKPSTATVAMGKLPVWERVLMKLQAMNQRLPLPLLKLPGKVVARTLRYVLIPLNFYRMYQVLKGHPVDVLHVINGGYPGAESARFAPLAAKLAGCRWCVMSVCNTAVPRAFPLFLEKFLDGFTGSFIDRFVVPGRTIGRYLCERRGIDQSKLELIPYGVKLSSQYASVGRKPFSGDRVPVIGAAGGLIPRKGFTYLLDAYAEMKARGIAFEAVFIGDGPMRAELERRVRGLRLKDRIRFLGHLHYDSMMDAMSSIDLFVLSSDLEGMPLVILQAMGLGRPIVSTDVGGVGDVLENGKTGILVPPRDPVALAEAMIGIMGNRSEALEMVRRSRLRFEDLYTLERMVAAHERLYLVNAQE